MLGLALLLCLLADELYVHENPGFELRLPSSAWQPRDQGGGGIVAWVFTPVEDMTLRCSVLRFPGAFLPDGLETRAAQIEGAAGEACRLVGFETDTLDGREATRWEYRLGGGTTIEWAFLDGPDWVVFQVAAPPELWDDPEQQAELLAIRDTFHWTGTASGEGAPVDLTAPAEVRALRTAAAGKELAFEVTKHTIEATIEPEDHSIDVQDTVELISRDDELLEIKLYTTLVTVDDVTANVSMAWGVDSLPQADALVIELEQPLAKGEALTLEIHAACEDFFQTMDQHLVAEISVLGQIRPRSSYSSHVVWYPMDEVNDAAVDITFDVPVPYTALSGGELVESSEQDGRRRFRYVEEYRKPRKLPYGFAVGEYVSREAVSEAGLRMTAWGFPDETKLLDQRHDVLLECAAAFERALGPLPWNEVRFIHVSPEEKETGVSLPGMIVVSDGYFPDLEGVDASSGNLADATVLGLLVVADEMSHQWNFYWAGFPNELAEGISTFTNALFLEVRHDAATYARTIQYCRDAWIATAGIETEFAIANPAVYSNSRYRPVVFCKTPVILDALRRRLGDEVFFDGFRRGFALQDLSVDGFERMEQGFEAASGEELRPFFDQWFFRAGFPVLELHHTVADGGVHVEVTQTQQGEPYRLSAVVQVTCEDASVHEFPVELQAAKQSFDWRLPAAPTQVNLGPLDRLPAQVIRR